MKHREYLLKFQFGYITSPEDIKKLIEENRLQQVLVRCGSGRFTCAIQDMDHFISIIGRDATDYVRDCSVF